jgi:hypothetical protein
MKRFSLLFALTLAACAPAVTHGPRVEPGTTVTANLGVYPALCRQNQSCDSGVDPELSLGLRRGFVRNPEGAAFLLGASLPLADLLAPELDAYAQAPAPGLFTGGAGALLSAHHAEPYIQAGLTRPNGDGWFGTLGYAWLFADPRNYFMQERPHMVRPPRYWAPGVGFTGHVLGRSMTVYANGALGHFVDRQVSADAPADTSIVRRNVHAVVVGISGQMSPSDFLHDLLGPLPIPFR